MRRCRQLVTRHNEHQQSFDVPKKYAMTNWRAIKVQNGRQSCREPNFSMASTNVNMSTLERYLWLTLLGPILWLQGKHARRVTPLLPEPTGPREGKAGQGPLIRILVAGDSAAAGVGASSQDEALCGQLVRRLSQHRTVEWQLIAVTGLDSPGLVKMLEEAPAEPFDVVILSIGVNDVTALRSPRQWVNWQSQLAGLVQLRFGPHLLIHSALPPMHGFTALPQPLRWFMGRWAHEMNRQLASEIPAQGPRIMCSPFQGAVIDGLATDGFHPGSKGYALWAEGLSRHILEAQSK
jgi:lysophospholipase L1-like esterase